MSIYIVERGDIRYLSPVATTQTGCVPAMYIRRAVLRIGKTALVLFSGAIMFLHLCGQGVCATPAQGARAGEGAEPVPGVVVAETAAMTVSDPDAAPLPDIEWSIIRPGLELGLAVLPRSLAAGTDDRFVILRIAPGSFNFTLHMASETGSAHSLPGWATLYGLLAGINASMYLPDNLTSTGLLRGPSHINNPRAGARLGAFFVADPKGKKLPGADILERGSKGLDDRLALYNSVAQNSRLVSGTGDILWPKGGGAHSTAVVSKDTKGNILFVLSQEPLSPYVFARYMKKFPLDAGPVMYVEGGGPAGLFLFEGENGNTARPGAVSYPAPGGVIHVWKGRQSVLNTKGNPEAPLPNIIGVKAR